MPGLVRVIQSKGNGKETDVRARQLSSPLSVHVLSYSYHFACYEKCIYVRIWGGGLCNYELLCTHKGTFQWARP